jgi:hypothetical protein
MWQSLADIFQMWEQLHSFPSSWQEIIQVHIPKPGKLRAQDAAVPASKLRPISIMSCWWRTYITARLAGSQERQWLDAHLVSSQHGGRKSHDSVSAFTILAQRYALGDFVGTLDLSRAFDHVSPARAVATLQWHGCPNFLIKGLHKLWSNQKRFLSWHGEFLPTPHQVRTSIPQGDGLSPRVLNLLLSVPAKVIQTQEPEAHQVIFMDDRSWACSQWASFRHILDMWTEHAGRLGLRDNESKRQFTAKSAAKRDRLRRAFGTQMVLHLNALGAYLGLGNIQEKESERIQKAQVCADKIRAAPVSSAVRTFVASAAASSKAAFGWISRAPAKTVVEKLEARVRKACYAQKMASPILTKLVLGHQQDVRFAGQAAISAVLRLVMKTKVELKDWEHTAGPAERCKAFLAGLGWATRSPWLWFHEKLGIFLCLHPRHARFVPSVELVRHNLRESWRCTLWYRFLDSKRHEAPALRHMDYDPWLTQSARNLAAKHKSAYAVGILCGAFVSPLMTHQMTRLPNENCIWCQDPLGSFDHVCWTCAHRPAEFTMDPPENAWTRRFGWGCEEVLVHLTKVREAVLIVRYQRSD